MQITLQIGATSKFLTIPGEPGETTLKAVRRVIEEKVPAAKGAMFVTDDGAEVDGDEEGNIKLAEFITEGRIRMRPQSSMLVVAIGDEKHEVEYGGQLSDSLATLRKAL